MRRAILVAAVIIGFRILSFVAYSAILESRIELMFVEELGWRANELQEILRSDGERKLLLNGIVSDRRFSQPGSGHFWQARAADGHWLRSGSLEGGDLPVLPADTPETALRLDRAQGGAGQILLLQRSWQLENAPAVLISVAVLEAEFDREILALDGPRLAVTFWVTVAMALVLALGLWVVSRPIRSLRAEISQLDRGRSNRIVGVYPPDLQIVADKLNTVLDAYAQRVSSDRAKSASLAHNVRSALVALTDELEGLERRHGNAASFASIRNSSKAIQRHLEYHLRGLGRSHATGPIMNSPTSIVPIIELVCGAVQRLHGEKRLFWDLGIGPDYWIKCDPNDLGEVLFSLLDNAGKWASSYVRCAWGEESGLCFIRIEDDGPGFQAAGPADLPEAASPVEAANSGLGMGLEIARELIVASGGQLSLSTSPFGGASVTIWLPLITRFD